MRCTQAGVRIWTTADELKFIDNIGRGQELPRRELLKLYRDGLVARSDFDNLNRRAVEDHLNAAILAEG